MAFPNLSSNIPMLVTQVSGAAITAAAATSMIPAASRLVLPAGYWTIGKHLEITMTGTISCAATTPGTARFDMRTGPSGTIVAFDTGALNLNVAGKTNVPYRLQIDLTCRSVGNGTATQLFGQGIFQSEAVIASATPATGGNGSLLVPVGTPGLGTGFDNTAQNVLDFFFTQTVATGSQTLNQLIIKELM